MLSKCTTGDVIFVLMVTLRESRTSWEKGMWGTCGGHLDLINWGEWYHSLAERAPQLCPWRRGAEHSTQSSCSQVPTPCIPTLSVLPKGVKTRSFKFDMTGYSYIIWTYLIYQTTWPIQNTDCSAGVWHTPLYQVTSYQWVTIQVSWYEFTISNILTLTDYRETYDEHQVRNSLYKVAGLS